MNAYSSGMVRAPGEANGNIPLRRGRALLVLPFFGSFGPWFPLYLHTLANQHTLDLLLVSDAEPPALRPNVRRLEMTLDEVRELATARLGTAVRLHRTRNICDLRPAYGIIFEEFIRGYEYWAFGDEDLIYGDVDRMLRAVSGRDRRPRGSRHEHSENAREHPGPSDGSQEPLAHERAGNQGSGLQGRPRIG